MPSQRDLPAIDEPQLFADFNLDPLLVSSLASQGITHTFPIQQLTLEVALTGADIIGQARTGTGKTLAFGLPLLNKINLKQGLQGLVIVPTRELCMQVAQDLSNASADKKIKVAAIYGGIDIDKQIAELNKGVHVVAGTPGRLLDLLHRGNLSFNAISTLVLDEADEMLNMGFLPDIEKIIAQVNDKRQTLLFSATMPAEIVTLGREYMHKPMIMHAETPEEDTIHERIDQYFFQVHGKDKAALVSRILASKEVKAAVVFCRTKNMVDRLVRTLKSDRLNARAIHSSLNQAAREKTLRQFRNGDITILVATEVAARGLDIDDVTHVINYDMPKEADMYVHRIGRTGRAGRKGIAITLALYDELPLLKTVLDELGIETEVPEMFSTFPELETLFGAPPLKTVKKRTNAYGTIDLDDDEPEVEEPKPTRGRRRKTIKASEVVEAEKAGRSTRRRRGKADEDETPVDEFNEFDQVETRRSSRRRTADIADEVADEAPDEVGDDPAIEDAPEVKPTRRSRRGKRAEETSDTDTSADNADDQATEEATTEDAEQHDAGVPETRTTRRSRRGKRTASEAAPPSEPQDTDTNPDGPHDNVDDVSGTVEDDADNAKGSQRRGRRGSADGDDASRTAGRSAGRNGNKAAAKPSNRSNGRSAYASVDELRGDGKPSLRRQMKITYLP